jgi:hypothetical protein
LKILVRQWGLRAKNDPILVLDAKGGEIKAKASKWISHQMDQPPLEDFEISSVRSFDLSKYSKYLFLSKVGLLWEECLIMGKRGSF